MCTYCRRIVSPSREETICVIGQDAFVQRNRIDGVMRQWEWHQDPDNGQIV